MFQMLGPSVKVALSPSANGVSKAICAVSLVNWSPKRTRERTVKSVASVTLASTIAPICTETPAGLAVGERWYGPT